MVFTDEMDKKRNTIPIDKVELIIGISTYDITSYYETGANFRQKKEREMDKISSGDITYTFTNHDNYFSELDPTSVFYEKVYLNQAKVKFYEGFRFGGVEEYELQSTLKVIEVRLDQTKSKCYIRCQDPMVKVIKEKINAYPTGLIAIADAGNTGDGTCSRIQTKPFSTVNEDVTVTLSGAANFTAVGSVSGALGAGVVGAEYTAAGNVCKFTITAGGVAFVNLDKFTFTTYKHPQWDDVNPVKIIWSVLTGYEWDGDVAEDWLLRTLQFDNTQAAGNTDIDYDSFAAAIADITYFTMSGAVKYDKPANALIEELTSTFLGAIWINPSGKIQISFYKPAIDGVLREFSDEKKITSLFYKRSLKNIINSAVGRYKATKTWFWSDDMERLDIDILDGYYATQNATSITAYGIEKRHIVISFWYSDGGLHVEWPLFRLVDKYGDAPTEISFDTGMDALQTKLADRIKVTESKSKLDNIIYEVMEFRKNFVSKPKKINVGCSNDNTTGVKWVFLGSSVNETDHDWSVGASQDWDTATDWEKQFCYLSTTGSVVQPLYYYF